MRTSNICLLVAVAFGLLAMPMIANAAWTTLDGQAIGEGIDYQAFSSGGCTVHVTRMPIGDDNYAIQACSARQSVNYPQESGGETGYGERIQDQLDWYDTSMNNYGFLSGDQWISWWQSTSNVIAAINGGPHNNGGSYGVTKGHMESGYLDSLIPDMSGLTGFIWTGLRQPVIGGCLDLGTPTVSYGAYTSTVARINSGTAEGDELVVFTPRQKGFKTPARSTSGKEVAVRQPERYMLNSGGTSTCYVWSIGNDDGDSWIPFDCIMLSGSGTVATQLATLSAGDVITCNIPATNRFTEEQDEGMGCVDPDTSVDWNDVFAYAGGTWRFLEDDIVLPNPSDTNADYRTAVAYNANYVYFVVVEEPGMNMQALGNFCKDTADIDATDGIALDGGANSQMVVNDSLITTNTTAYSAFSTNDAPVADGLMMARIVPKELSTRSYFWVDSEVDTVASSPLRIGPGENYPLIDTIPSGTTITVKFHHKNGYKSTDKYWTYVEYDGKQGFMWDTSLEECILLWGGGTSTTREEGGSIGMGAWFQGNIQSADWYKLVDGDWEAVQYSTGHISTNEWGDLDIDNIQLNDAGYYRRTAICGCGTISSDTCGLVVTPKWTPLDGEAAGDGIDYREFDYDGSTVYVTRMPVDDEDYAIEACSARRAVNYGDDDGEGEIILDQIQYYADQPNSYGFYTAEYGPWCRRPTIYAAINGGPFNSGTASGLQITNGHIQQSFYACCMPELEGLSGFFWGMDTQPHIGGCIEHGTTKAYWGAYDKTISNINSGTATSNDLVMFTSQNPGSRTPARGTAGKEVVLRSLYPFGFNTGTTSTGIVEYIGDDYGETWIQFDSVALSASGTTATALATLSIGNTVTIQQELINHFTEEQDPGYGCVSTDTSVPWDEAYAYVGGTWRFLEDDVVLPNSSDTTTTYRTGVAYNDDYVYFVTAEAMNAEDMGDFCKDTLEATDGILLKGGVSTQMVVDGRQKVMNSLAYSTYDDWQAPVADGLMMTKQNAKSFSQNPFWNYWPADTVIDTALRTGPGDSYPIICEVEAEETVTLEPHVKNGVLSGDYHWQNVEYDGKRGWIEEEALDCCFHLWEPTSLTRSINDTDVPFGTCFNGQITSIQWYKYVSGDWVAVENDTGHIHGADTDCLVFDVVEAGDDGTYRAKATGACGDEDYCDSCTLTIE